MGLVAENWVHYKICKMMGCDLVEPPHGNIYVHVDRYSLSFDGDDMEEYKIMFMRIREYFRKNEQTNWGKLQIIKKLDELENEMDREKEIHEKTNNNRD